MASKRQRHSLQAEEKATMQLHSVSRPLCALSLPSDPRASSGNSSCLPRCYLSSSLRSPAFLCRRLSLGFPFLVLASLALSSPSFCVASFLSYSSPFSSRRLLHSVSSPPSFLHPFSSSYPFRSPAPFLLSSSLRQFGARRRVGCWQRGLFLRFCCQQEERRCQFGRDFAFRPEGCGGTKGRRGGLAMTDGDFMGCMYTPGHISPYTTAAEPPLFCRSESDKFDLFSGFLRRRLLFLHGPLTDQLAASLAAQLLYMADTAQRQEEEGSEHGAEREDEARGQGERRGAGEEMENESEGEEQGARGRRERTDVFCPSSRPEASAAHLRKRRNAKRTFLSSVFPDSLVSPSISSCEESLVPSRSSTRHCEEREKEKLLPVDILINSPGGSVTAALGILDLFQSLPFDVHTTCVGQAAGVAAMLLAAGTPGCRRAFPSSRLSLRQIEGHHVLRSTPRCAFALLVHRHLARTRGMENPCQ